MSTEGIRAVLTQTERFVWLVVAGGLSMVAGLWLVTLFESTSPVWGLGLGAVGLGIALLGVGIASQIPFELT